MSGTAERLLRVLAEPACETSFREIAADVSRLSDDDLGVLLPAVYAPGPVSSHASSVRLSVGEAGRRRQPRYRAETCAAMFGALVAGLGVREWADLKLGTGALLRCPEPWPDLAAPAQTLVRHLLDADRLDQPLALLAVAGLAGEDVLGEAAARVKADRGDLTRDEIELILGWTVRDRALISEVSAESSYDSPPPLPGVWDRLARTDYAAFARRALEVADARVAAIHAGAIPYAADRAFTRDEVGVLGRAVRVALLRDEFWLPEVLGRLVPGVAIAPTEARTLPSQALLYEVARAAEDFPTPETAAALRTARSRTRHKGVPKQLDPKLKRIETALAERPDVAFRLPDLGFGPDGVRRVPAGDHVAVITVTGDADLTWHKADGGALRGTPSAVRRDHPETVVEVRDLVKLARAHLSGLARALEATCTTETVHRFADWSALAAHPVGGHLVRRLIWEIEVAPGRWQAVLPASGEVAAAPDTPVRLWHPIRAEVEEIRAWRDLLTEHRIRQPFKQAFREIYLVTPAERETRTYSNRFAGHIVHYRRLYALFKGRGWTSRLLGRWDGGDEAAARGHYAAGRWRACLHHEYADHADGMELAATDQVRFEREQDGIWSEAPIADVPPVVFSEAMRDVDLFVGVTSIAADEDWTDRGEDRLARYWRTTSFGELTPAAETRADALRRILPRTKIADRCAIAGRYLIVRGDLRTYRIHLGSANILMEPDDSYLCIVPSRRPGTGTVFLPFEDERLALILSKAFLLAADATIIDESITLQIKRGGD